MAVAVVVRAVFMPSSSRPMPEPGAAVCSTSVAPTRAKISELTVPNTPVRISTLLHEAGERQLQRFAGQHDGRDGPVVHRPAAFEQFLDGGVAFPQQGGVVEFGENLFGGIPFGPALHELGDLGFLPRVVPDAPDTAARCPGQTAGG